MLQVSNGALIRGPGNSRLHNYYSFCEQIGYVSSIRSAKSSSTVNINVAVITVTLLALIVLLVASTNL